MAAMGSLRMNPLLVWAAVLFAGVACSELELRSDDGHIEVFHVSPDQPASLCLREADQPEWWAWPATQVRLLLSRPEETKHSRSFWSYWKAHASSSQLRLSVRAVPGPMCRYLAAVWPKVARVCRVAGMCKNCTERCPSRALPVIGSPDLAVRMPTAGSCVYLETLPAGVERMQASWDLRFDAMVFVFLFAGLVLVWGSGTLQESAALHAGIGGVTSLVFVLAAVSFWLLQGFRNRGLFGRSVTSLGALTFAFVPAVRDAALGMLMAWLPTADWKMVLKLRDPVYGLPIGWLAASGALLACLGFVAFGARLSIRYFAEGPDPEGPVEFTVDSDGRRVDRLPAAPLPQRLLGWTFWVSGVALLLRCSDSGEFSLAVTVMALLKDHIWLFLQLRSAAWWPWQELQVRPEDLRELMTSEEMNQQAKSTTEKALAALREHLKEQPSAMAVVREDTELRLRRWTEGSWRGVEAEVDMEEVPGCRGCCPTPRQFCCAALGVVTTALLTLFVFKAAPLL